MAATEVKYPEQVNTGVGRFDADNTKFYTPGYGDISEGKLAGMIVSGPHKVVTRIAENDVPFGTAVIAGSKDELCKGVASDTTCSSGTKAIGVAIRSASEDLKYPKAMAVNVMTNGSVWMEATASVTLAVGAAVYMNMATGAIATAAGSNVALVGKALTSLTSATGAILVEVNA